MPTSQQMMQILTPALESNNIMTNIRMLYGPLSLGPVTTTTTALSGNILSNANNTVAWLFCIPRDGVVTDIGFYISAKSGTPPAYNAVLAIPDTSGRPTTNPYGGSAITSFTPTTTGQTWVTLGTPATVAAGDYAIVYIYPGGTPPDVSNSITVTSTAFADIGGVAMNFTASYSVQAFAGPIAIRYDDGSIHGVALGSNTIHVQIRSNTTPDEVGNVFQLPVAMTCFGAKFAAVSASWGSAATADVILYDVNDNVLASCSITDKDQVDDANTISVFWDSVNLVANTSYRLALRPNVSTNGDIYTPKWTFESAAALAAIPCGDMWQYTSRTDAGAWTDDPVALCPWGLWVSAIEFTSQYAFSG